MFSQLITNLYFYQECGSFHCYTSLTDIASILIFVSVKYHLFLSFSIFWTLLWLDLRPNNEQALFIFHIYQYLETSLIRGTIFFLLRLLLIKKKKKYFFFYPLSKYINIAVRKIIIILKHNTTESGWNGLAFFCQMMQRWKGELQCSLRDLRCRRKETSYLSVQSGHGNMPLEALQSHWEALGCIVFVVHEWFTHVWLFATPWTIAHHVSLSSTVSWSLLKLKPIESVMPSYHLILCHPLLLPSASGSFPVSQLSAWGGQSTGASASASALPMNIQHWFPLN